MTATPPDARNALAEIVAGSEPDDHVIVSKDWLLQVRAAFEKAQGVIREGFYARIFRGANYSHANTALHNINHVFDEWPEPQPADKARIAALEAQVEGMRVALKRILNGKEIADKRYPGSTVVIDLPLDKIEEICRAALQSSETTGEK